MDSSALATTGQGSCYRIPALYRGVPSVQVRGAQCSRAENPAPGPQRRVSPSPSLRPARILLGAAVPVGRESSRAPNSATGNNTGISSNYLPADLGLIRPLLSGTCERIPCAHEQDSLRRTGNNRGKGIEPPNRERSKGVRRSRLERFSGARSSMSPIENCTAILRRPPPSPFFLGIAARL